MTDKQSKVARRAKPSTVKAEGNRMLSRRQFGLKIGVSERTVERLEGAGVLPPARWLSPRRRGQPLSLADDIVEGRVSLGAPAK